MREALTFDLAGDLNIASTAGCNAIGFCAASPPTLTFAQGPAQLTVQGGAPLVLAFNAIGQPQPSWLNLQNPAAIPDLEKLCGSDTSFTWTNPGATVKTVTVNRGGGTISVYQRPSPGPKPTDATWENGAMHIPAVEPWLLLKVTCAGSSQLVRGEDFALYAANGGGTLLRLTHAGLAKLEETRATQLTALFSGYVATADLA